MFSKDRLHDEPFLRAFFIDTMGYFRHIKAQSLPVEAMSIAIDENRAVLRFLTELRGQLEFQQDELPKGISAGNPVSLLETGKLGASYVSPEKRNTFYEINGHRWVVFAEAVLDKREQEFARIWTPGVHIVFYYDPARGLKIDVKGALAGASRRNTAELIRYKGGVWCFDLWVRTPSAPLTECSRSITTAPGTLLFTNLTDLGLEQTADYVMQGARSKWLTLDYRLTPESPTVAPDGVMHYTFEVLDGKTKEVAKDVSWDGWRIEAVDGYAPHKRICVKNGVGRFRVVALGIESGESMRVKVANRFDPSIAECTVECV